MPKIVIFRGKGPAGKSAGGEYYLSIAGNKYPVYKKLFDLIAGQAELYAVFGYENSTGNMNFNNAYKYLVNGKFALTGENIKADAVYDRSYRLDYPGVTNVENKRVINCLGFKEFSRDKLALAQKYPEFCPKTIGIKSQAELLADLSGNRLMVYKPVTGMKGKGILFIESADDLVKEAIEYPGILQEFMETESGIPGLLTGRHDMRVVVINGEIVWATARQPKGDSLLANVAQGGSIREIPIQEVPLSAVKIVNKLAQDFKNEYHNPLFSVDFGFRDGKPFIYEINDQIGFPLPEMKNNEFVQRLAEELLRCAN